MKYALGMPPDAAQREFAELVQKTARPYVALEAWEKCFDEEQRRRLGNDFRRAYQNPDRTAGMWARAYGISVNRAVIAVAAELQMIAPRDANWLIDQLKIAEDGCSPDLRAAIGAGYLVICSQPRRLFWEGEEVDLAELRGRRWEYLLKLASNAKQKVMLDRSALGENLDEHYLTKLKSRLINQSGLPPTLGDKILNVEKHCQRLDLSSSEIHFFEMQSRTEWTQLSSLLRA